MVFSEPYRGIYADGSGPVDGMRPSDLEGPLGLLPDAVLALAACPLVEGPGGGPPLEVAIGTFGPDVLAGSNQSKI